MNVIAAPWIIADCKNLLAHFADRKDELDANILIIFSNSHSSSWWRLPCTRLIPKVLPHISSRKVIQYYGVDGNANKVTSYCTHIWDK
jgi:hypothetical protein